MADPQAYKLADWIGYLTRPEIDLMIILAQSLPANPVVINIGAGVGTSGMAFMEARQDLTLYTIDVNDHDNPYGGLMNERNAFEWSGFLGAKRHHQIHDDSKKVGKRWRRGAVDCVFIDGDHTDEGVIGDIENWKPRIKDGGIMIFHDYFSPFHGAVKWITDQYFQPDQEIGRADSVIAFRIEKSK